MNRFGTKSRVAAGATQTKPIAGIRAGDVVMCIDADRVGTISNRAEYVFTEWDPTASDDMQAVRRVFDTDGEGKLTEADARWGEFCVMVTHADGTTKIESLTELVLTLMKSRSDNLVLNLKEAGGVCN